MTVPTVPRPAGWLPATRAADGKPFFIVPGSKPGVVYYAAADGCTCPDARHRGRVCKHQRAVAKLEQRQQPPTPAPKPLRRYEDIFHACAGGCGDVVERPGARCYPCASDEAYRLKQAARRAV